MYLITGYYHAVRMCIEVAFNPLTYERVDLGYILAIMGQMGLKSPEVYFKQIQPLNWLCGIDQIMIEII